MSHEIRTPLNAITGFAEVLGSANTEEEKAQYQEIIKMNADLLMQLVNDILDMSKIEAGTLEFVQTTVDVNLLLSDLQQLFQMRVNEAGENIQIISRTVSFIMHDPNGSQPGWHRCFPTLLATPLNSPMKVVSASDMRQEILNFTFM